MATVTSSITLIPNGYTNTGSYNFTFTDASNMYKDSTSTSSYATLQLASNRNNTRTSTCYINFDKSELEDIPSNATINSVTAKIRYSVTSTTYVSAVSLQLYSGSTAKGSALTTRSTSQSQYTMTAGTWTRAELENIQLYTSATHNASTNTASLRIYGIDIEISYSTTAYDISVSNQSSNVTSVSPATTQTIAEGGDYELHIISSNTPGDDFKVEDNSNDVTNQLVAHYPSYSTSTVLGEYSLVSGGFSGSGASYFQGLVGKGVNNTQTTSNYYSSGSGTIAVFTYKLEFSNIPSNATITNLYVQVNGHCENANQSSEYMCVQIMTGSTALSDEFNFKSAGTSNTTQTINATILPTVSQLSDLKLQCRLGYYGGAINGATAYIEYEIPSSSSDPDYYIYTIENVVADHAIVISNSTYAVSASQASGSANVTLNPSASQNISHGGTYTLTITPSVPGTLTVKEGNTTVQTWTIEVGNLTAKTFTVNNVTAAHTYSVNLTELTKYNVTASENSTYLSIASQYQSQSVYSGQSVSIQITSTTPGTITVSDNGTNTNYPVTANGTITHTISSVVAAHTITATFTIATYAVSTSLKSGSSSVTINPASSTVDYEGSYTVTLTPSVPGTLTISEGSTTLQTWTIPIGDLSAKTYTVNNITATHTYTVNLTELTKYNVTASESSEYLSIPSGYDSQSIYSGQSCEVKFTSTTPGTITVTDNGVDSLYQVTSANQTITHTISSVTAAHTVTATFTTITYNISASVQSGSSSVTLSPSGTQSIGHGSSYTLTMTPSVPGTLTISEGSTTLQTWTIPVGNLSAKTYTVNNITAAHTYVVNLTELTKYNVTASESSEYLSIPFGYASQSVYSGQSCDVKFTSTTPGTITVTDNSVDSSYQVTSANQTITHTISSVTAAHTITAIFTIASYAVSASSSVTGVTLSPASQTINYGSSCNITITSTNPGTVVITDNGTDSSYTISTINGNATHTISSVTAAHTITVKSFASAKYTVTATKGANITSVSPTSQSLDYGSNVSLTVTPSIAGTLTIKETNLPYDAEIEYLQSTGTQYMFFDDYIVNPNTEYYLTLKFSNLSSNYSSSNKGVYSARNTGGDTDCSFSVNFGGSASQTTTLFWWTNKTYASGATVKSKDYGSSVLTNKNTIHYTNGNINYGGTNFSVTTKTTTNGQGFSLFGTGTTTPFSAYYMYVYGFKFIENSITIHDYIPVRIGTEGYLYDKITGRLFGNTGTGSFVLGPDVDTSGTLTIYEQEISQNQAGTAITCSNIYTNLSANHNITALLTGLEQYNVTVVNNSSSILSYTPASPISLYSGDTLTINFVPSVAGILTITDSADSSNNQTYNISASDVNAAKVYTITNVTADRTITANLSIASYAVSASSSVTGVTLTPASQTINYGQSATITIKSTNPGTVVITDNSTDHSYNITVPNGTATYTISPVSAAHTITVKSFTLAKYTVTATTGTNVTTVSPASQSLDYGSNVSLNVTPAVPGTLYIKETNLPYDAEIEYLQSSGTQYINTGFIPDDNSGLYVRACCTTSGGNHVVAGTRQSSDNTRWWINFSAGLEISWNTYISYSMSYTNVWVEVENNFLNSRLGKIDGVTKRTSYPTLANITYPAYIFTGNEHGNLTSVRFTGKISNVKISQGNNIVMDFIPVRKNGVGYLYDKVSGQLFGNDGTGSFTLGPDVDTSGTLTIYSTDVSVGQQGTSKTCSNIYTNLSVNHSVIASVDELAKYNVSVTNNSSTYLTVTPSSTQSIYSGQNATIQIKTTKAGTVSIIDNVTGNTSYLEYSNSELNTNKSFTLENVTSAHTLTISLSTQTYPVSVSTSSEYITITSQTPVNIADGSNYQVTATASIPGTVTLKEGNTTINSANVTSPNGTYSYNVTNITSQRTFTLLFTPTNYTVSASVSSGSDVTIISGASYSGIYGTQYTLTFRSGSIGTVSVNDSGNVTTYTISQDKVNQTQTYQKTVTGNSTITLSNSIDTYDITGTIASGSSTYLKYVDNGTDKTSISKTVNAGSNYTLNIKSTHPGTLSLSINGNTSTVELSDSYTYPYTYQYEITNILSAVSVSASFSVLTFDIQDNGSTVDNIIYGQSYTYTFTPTAAGTYNLYDNDNLIETYNITAAQVGIEKSYTINSVTSLHNFRVSSTVSTYTITVTNNAQTYISNINISNRNPEYNGSSVITIYPRLKGTINIADNNGIPTTISTTGVQKEYTLQNITTDHTIVITFTPGTYTATLTNNIPSTYNYTLSKNSGNYSVTGCETFSFTLSANQTGSSKTTMNGKVIVARTISGSTIRKTYSIIKDTPFSVTYTVEDVVNDMTITLTFEETQEAPANGDRFLKPFNNDSEAQTYITNNNPNPFISYRRNSKTVDYTSHLGNMRMTTQIYRDGNGHKLFERN